MNLQLNNSVMILTFGFGSVDQNTREILQDIAEQNTARYNVSVNSSVGDITVHICLHENSCCCHYLIWLLASFANMPESFRHFRLFFQPWETSTN